MTEKSFPVETVGAVELKPIEWLRPWSSPVNGAHPVLLSYMAGVVDSDGHIGLYLRHHSNPRKGGKLYPYYDVSVSVSNTHFGILELFKWQFGGGIYAPKKKKEHHKVWGMWRVSHRQAFVVAETLGPYLRIKRERAEVIVEFAKTVKPGNNQPISSEVRGRRNALVAEMKSLNKVGV